MPELPATTTKGKWIYGIFSETDGTASFGRVGSAVALVSVIAWVWYLLIHNHIPTLPTLGDASVFVGAPYGLNKLATAFGKANQ